MKDYHYEMEGTQAKRVELYPTTKEGMFKSVLDGFVFTSHGKPAYTMTYNEADVLYKVGHAMGVVQATIVLRAFRPTLDLKLAHDVVGYVLEHFTSIGD